MTRAETLTSAQPNALRDLILFLLVGGTGAVAFIALSSALIELHTGLPEWMVSALCWAALIGPVYLGHRILSFRSSAPHGQALPRYILVQLCGVTLAALFSFLCYRVLGFSSIVGAALVAVFTAGMNFFVLRLWAFATR
jgi:putative flippase GtrA